LVFSLLWWNATLAAAEWMLQHRDVKSDYYIMRPEGGRDFVRLGADDQVATTSAFSHHAVLQVGWTGISG
jgi:hypothetical protein